MKTKIIESLKSNLSLLVTITIIVGVMFRLDSRWAKATDVKQLEQNTQQHIQKVAKRLDLKILKDALFAIRERMWKLQDIYKTVDQMPPEIKEEYRKLEIEKEELQKQIDDIVKEIKTKID